MNSRLTNEQRNRLEVLAEEYGSRKRRGESVSIEQYLNEYPELADDIQELFPLLEMLDQAVASSTPGIQISNLNGEIGPGTQLGEYRLIKPLGRGGMGVVYQAEHVTLRSSVAIKLLPVGLDRPKLRERFQREASAAARMHHPNIVRVFDFGSHGETLYYVMSLVEGWGLNRIVDAPIQAGFRKQNANSVSGKSAVDSKSAVDGKSAVDDRRTKTIGNSDQTRVASYIDQAIENSAETRFDFDTQVESELADSELDRSKFSSTSSKHDSLWSWVARIGVQAADALDYAHSMGVIHRDIKPSNLMIDVEETVHVLDFGLAKVADDNSLTATGDVLGTLRYMPPESFAGRADHRSDIYSLGLTLYELLANRPAFEDVERGKLIPAITNGQITRLRKLIPKIPVDLETVIHKAIRVDPKNRYASASELRDDLKNFLTGQPVKARRTTWIYRSFRWVSRNKIVSSLAASVFALLTVAALISTISANRFENLASEKEAQRVAATNAETTAIAKTRESQLNLLSAKLSDAGGWSTSRRPGHRVEGMNALREGIDLAKQLGVFNEHRYKINETAVTLSTLHDIPPILKWKHPVKMTNYAPTAFNGDLSQYAAFNYREQPYVCRVFQSSKSTPELLETIPIKGVINEQDLKFSHDSRYLVALMWLNEKTYLWIYDRDSKQSFHHETEAKSYSPVTILNESGKVIFLDQTNRLNLVNLFDGETVSKIELPDSVVWNKFAVSADESMAALYRDSGKRIVLVDLKDGICEDLEFGDQVIHSVSWRPDGKQIAIAGQRIRIWDIAREHTTAIFDTTHQRITEMVYNSNGRLLITSGWDHTTRVYDPLAERQVIRCEGFLKGISADGTKIVTHGGQRFIIRSVIASEVVKEFDFSRNTRSLNVGIDATTGTLWVGADNKTSVIDFSGNRFLHSFHLNVDQNFIAFDPLGRDVFVSTNTLSRFPIRVDYDEASENDEASGKSRIENAVRKIQIGPRTLMSWPGAAEWKPGDIAFDSGGKKLAVNDEKNNCQIVFGRDSNWNPISHTHSDRPPIRFEPHPSLPLITTSAHHSNGIEVRDTASNRVVFSLPTKLLYSKFSPDGELLLVADEGSLRTFRVGTWEQVAETDVEIRLKQWWFCVSPDSQWVAVETEEPRGVTILNLKTLRPVLQLNGDHTHPESYVGSFDSSGRLLCANRGKSAVGVWDLYKLRQHFESLDLEWPLKGLGNPTPVRDPSVPVDLIWESVEPE